MKRNIILLACVGAVILIAVGGCPPPPHKQMVKREYNPKRRKMLIIPFSDSAFDYFESDEGTVVAEATGWYILTQNITPIMYGVFLPPGVKAVYQAHANDTTEAWKEIADALGCELVLVGQINGVPVYGDPDSNLVRGEIIISAQLLDMKKDGEVAWRMTEKKIVYPEGWEHADGVDGLTLSKGQLKNRLLSKVGEVIGKHFHDHLEPKASKFEDPM